MAIVKRSIIGELKGSLSGLVFRQRNGKVVAYSRPVKQKVSKSEASVNARNKFAITVALAKKINSDPLLSAIWKNSKLKATNAYQKIIKINSKLSEAGFLTLNNKITPESLIIPAIEIKFDSSGLNVKINCNEIDKRLLKAPRLYYLIHYYKNSKMSGKYFLELQYLDLPDLSQTDEYNLIGIVDKKKNKGNAIILFAITTQPSERKKILWSQTIGFQLY